MWSPRTTSAQYGTLVDVGGGRGVLLAAILKSAPALRGILFDLDASIPAALAYLREVGVDDRVECVGGDFFDEAPPGADVYVMSRVLHDWDDDDATRILTIMSHSMRPDSRLLVVDAVLPERATDRPDAVRMDILMLMFLGARERTDAGVPTASSSSAGSGSTASSSHAVRPPASVCWRRLPA